MYDVPTYAHVYIFFDKNKTTLMINWAWVNVALCCLPLTSFILILITESIIGGSDARACLLMRTLFLKRKAVGLNRKRMLPRNDCGKKRRMNEKPWAEPVASWKDRRKFSLLCFLHCVEFSIFYIFSLFDALWKNKRTRHRGVYNFPRHVEN